MSDPSDDDFVQLESVKPGDYKRVRPENVNAELKSGKWKLAGGSSGVVDQYGKRTVLSNENYNKVTDLGYDPTLTTQAQDAQLRAEEAHDTIGSKGKAALGGAANALSLGFANPWSEDQEFHPGYATAGKVGGIAATLLIPGAGEENLARTAGELGVDAIKGAETVGDIAQGSRIGRAIGYTPLGLATRAGRAAEGLVGGATAGGRIAQTAIGGAVGGGIMGAGTELSHQLLDQNATFSAENLIGATFEGAALGGGIGAAGSAISEGLGYAASKLGKASSAAKSAGLSTEEYLARNAKIGDAAIPDGMTRTPMADMLNPKNVSLLDGVTSRSKDVVSLGKSLEALSDAPALAKKLGWDTAKIAQAQASVENELLALKSISKFEGATTANLAADMHANDLVGAELSKIKQGLPARWSDADLRAESIAAKESVLKDIATKRSNGMPISAAEEDAARVSSQLGLGKAPAEVADIKDGLVAQAGKWLAKKVPGGKFVSALGTGGVQGAAIVAAEHLLEHGVMGLIGHAALPAAGVAVAGKLIRAAFKDPHIGGIIAAGTSNILNSTGVLKGRQVDNVQSPQRALRNLGDRLRTITPQQVAANTAASMSHLAGAAPLSVSAASQLAAKRHQALLDIVNTLDPKGQALGAHSLLGRPLPSSANAHKAADAIKTMASSQNFMFQALNGRLTQQQMALAEQLYPATVQKVRTELLSGLADADPSKIPASNRKQIEMILGKQILPQSQSSDYRIAMASSIAKATKVTPPQQSQAPRPSGPIEQSPLASPALRIARPGSSSR